MGKTKLNSIGKAAVAVSQIGFSVVAPIFLFLWIGLKAREHFGLPDVFVVALILLGFATGVYAAILFLIRMNKNNKNK